MLPGWKTTPLLWWRFWGHVIVSTLASPSCGARPPQCVLSQEGRSGPPVRSVTFPWISCLQDRPERKQPWARGDVTDSKAETTRRRAGGGGGGAGSGDGGGGGGVDSWTWHWSGVWREQLADLVAPLWLSRSAECEPPAENRLDCVVKLKQFVHKGTEGPKHVPAWTIDRENRLFRVRIQLRDSV